MSNPDLENLLEHHQGDQRDRLEQGCSAQGSWGREDLFPGSSGNVRGYHWAEAMLQAWGRPKGLRMPPVMHGRKPPQCRMASPKFNSTGGAVQPWGPRSIREGGTLARSPGMSSPGSERTCARQVLLLGQSRGCHLLSDLW